MFGSRKKVALFWDFSLGNSIGVSREQKEKEIGLLRELCEKLPDHRLDLLEVRHRTAKAGSFDLARGQCSELIRRIEETPYDGGKLFCGIRSEAR